MSRLDSIEFSVANETMQSAPLCTDLSVSPHAMCMVQGAPAHARPLKMRRKENDKATLQDTDPTSSYRKAPLEKVCFSHLVNMVEFPDAVVHKCGGS